MMGGKGLLLIALGVGYFVLLAASKEKKQVKLLGQILGWGIIVLAILGIWCYFQQCFTSGMTGKGSCPFSNKMVEPSPLTK